MLSRTRAAWDSLFAPSGHSPAVGLRAIAMLWVIWFHGTRTSLMMLGKTFGGDPFKVSPYAPPSIGDVLAMVYWPLGPATAGDTGVDLFLVLSGFLLGGMLSSELERSDGRIDAVRFYCRRWFRILPAYASAMVVDVMIFEEERKSYSCPSLWWSNLLFMNNIWPLQGFVFAPHCMVHTWSIAVEFQMYLLTPPLLLLSHAIAAGRFRFLQLPWAPSYFLVLALGFLACVYRRTMNIDYEHGSAQPYNGTSARIAPYLAGVAAAIAVKQHSKAPYSFPGPWARACLRLISWLVLIPAAYFGAEPMYFQQDTLAGWAYPHAFPTLHYCHIVLGRPLVGLATAFLLADCLTGHAHCLSAFLSAPCWRPLAALSYSMYLLQYVGAAVFDPLFKAYILPRIDLADGLRLVYVGAGIAHLKAVIVIIATMPLALCNYLLIEHPLHMYGRDAASQLSEWCGRRKSSCCGGRDEPLM